MLYHFFSISIITIFSFLSGILIMVVLDDFGVLLAFVFYAMMFLVDYITTIRVKNYQKYETNPLFRLFSKKFDAKISFAMIFVIAIVINVISYYVMDDFVLCYILGMCHLCTAMNNNHISKKLSTLQQEKIQ